ncbi:hypothetical protein WJX75_004678 [Coccomyxa subellipsoidea]|uniref:Uncharacterized protein n=1 Tax=Coccomyxa subellipsoidea TaxID=248742 RepID=A0ABR2Z1B2_9CHLO
MTPVGPRSKSSSPHTTQPAPQELTFDIPSILSKLSAKRRLGDKWEVNLDQLGKRGKNKGVSVENDFSTRGRYCFLQPHSSLLDNFLWGG